MSFRTTTDNPLYLVRTWAETWWRMFSWCSPCSSRSHFPRDFSPLSWISHTSVTTVWCWGSSFSPTRCIRCSRRWTRSCIRWWQNNGDECWWRLFISTVRPTLLLFKPKVHPSLLINWMWGIGKLVNLFGMKFRAILLSTSNLLQNMRKTLNQNLELLLHF